MISDPKAPADAGVGEQDTAIVTAAAQSNGVASVATVTTIVTEVDGVDTSIDQIENRAEDSQAALDAIPG